MDHLAEAAKLRPDSTVSWVFLADARYRQSGFADAIATLEQGLQATGDPDEVRWKLGQYHCALGHYEIARDYFQEALAITPDYLEAAQDLRDISAALAILKDGAP